MSPIWFPPEEYRARFEKLGALLETRNLDALLVSHDINMRYYAGYRQTTAHASPSRVTTAIIPRGGDPVIFAHVMLAADVRASVWFEDVRLFHHLAGPPLEEIAGEIRARGIRRLAAELGPEQRLGMPPNDFLALRERLAGVEWVDAGELVWQQRIRKSPAELDCLRRAGRATARAYEAAFPRIHGGMTEREAANLLQRAMLEAGAEQIAYVATTSGEGNYGRIGGTPSHRRLQKGEMLWVDMGARVDDYCADFSRAGVVGGPDDRQRRMHELVMAATAKGVERCGPGVPVADVVRACDQEMKRRGLQITLLAGRIGHGLGLNITEPPHVALYDPTVLEPGMVITVEPGVVESYGTFHVEENLIITEDGHEVISTASRELWTI